jgi:DNA-binding NarL/FixJ family response regulator
MDAAPTVPRALSRCETSTARLTGRELLVLQLLECGHSRQRVATLLDTTDEVVAAYERRACAALGVRDTRQAVKRAVERRLIAGGELAAAPRVRPGRPRGNLR